MTRFAFVLGVVLLCGACAHTVDPKVAPATIAPVQPPIHARAVLLLAASFETYTSKFSAGVHRYDHPLGASAALALTDVITQSFDSAEARSVSDAEALQWLAGAADTSLADLLIIPRFETGGYSESTFEMYGDVRLRLDVRSYRTAHTYSWTGVGHSSGTFRSYGGLTGDALVQAVSALADSLRVHRSALEARR